MPNRTGPDGRLSVLVSGPTPPWAPNPYVHDLAEALGRLDDLDVRLAPVAEPYPRALAPQRVAGVAARPARHHAAEAPIRWWAPWGWTAAGLRRRDIVHLQWWNYALLPEFAVIARLARRRGARVVVTVHNAVPHEATPLRRWFNAQGPRLGDHLVVHTQATRDSLTAQGVPADRIEVVPHGIHPAPPRDPARRAEARRRLGLPADQPVMLAFGTLRPYKRTLELLDRFAAAGRGHLVIAGAPWGTYGEEVRARVEALALGARVTLDLRTIDDETKERYYAAADSAAVPRAMDAASGAIAEALSNGLALETWGEPVTSYAPWPEVADRTARLYRRLLER